jgi:hypothetical protein
MCIVTTEEDLNYWFAGFTDGDGYFYVKNNEISFQITTNNLDFCWSKYNAN